MRHAVAEDDPAVLGSAFAAARVSHMNGLVAVKSPLPEDGHGADAGVVAEDLSGAPGRIRGMAQGQEGNRAQDDPRSVERQKPPRPAIRDLRADGGIIPAP